MTSVAATEPLLRKARAAFTRDDFATAFASAGEALTRAPALLEARVIRLNAALKLERWQDAIADLEQLLAAQPQQAKLQRTLSMCWLRIGNAHKSGNHLAAAADAYRKALGVDAGNHDAGFNLGVLLLDGYRPGEAVPLLRRIVQDVPTDSAAVLKLAQALIDIGQNAEAIALLTRLAARHDTREHWQQCSKLMLEASSLGEAKNLARRLIHEQPETSEWAREFCRQLRKDSDLAGSHELLDMLRMRSQDSVERLRIDLADALGLPSVYADRATLQATRADFLARLDQFIAAYPPERVAAIAPPPDALLWDNFHLAYQGENDREPQQRFGTWLSRSLQALLPAFTAPAAPPHRPRPRLGLVSSRWYESTVGSYFASWVEHLAGCGWELILVHVGAYRDHVTERLAKRAHGELTLDGSMLENAHKLRDLGADLLLYPELGMDYRTLAMAALRLAPRQVCAWGHPVTTGLPTIDAFLSCAEMEPVDAHMHYSERLLTLPGLGTRYLSPEIPAAAAPSGLGLPAHSKLYLVPQSLFKLHPDNDSIFVDIARRDPDAELVFFRGIESGALRAFRDRLTRAFAQAGMVLDRRVRFLPMRARADYLRINLACDVMLDSLHWSGGNTSLDALHTGLPVVTSPGRFMRGRQSQAMLQRLSCAELIADSAPQLAALAVEIAHDSARREALTARIRTNLPALVQSDEPLHALDAILRQLTAEV
jgi:CRISPR-associated protein Csy1